MADFYGKTALVSAIAAASHALTERREEVNRLNVFPVPDGDTGTNMSLTLESVVENLSQLPMGASSSDMRKAITTGALMGARGNSGVITSQILRGLCEGFDGAENLNAQSLSHAFNHAVDVAFKAVRKPVEGTILTVLRDTAHAMKKAARKKSVSTDDLLVVMVDAASASVERTPALLPVLKENQVVDAGGFGLAILLDAFASDLMGTTQRLGETSRLSAPLEPKVEIEQINDWEDANYRYCTEFLVFSETLNVTEGLEFLASMGDCELLVGDHPNFKVHVHTDAPDKVLAYMLKFGQISEVHIHNMELQSAERAAKLSADRTEKSNAPETPRRPVGFVAVAVGEGNAKILQSLGVDVVVSGGQTMNPSTKDLLDAIKQVHADKVIVLPNNKNIIMAAQSAVELSATPSAVVPTRSIPEAFSALLVAQEGASLKDNVALMSSALDDITTGEVTRAIKDAKDAHGNPIAANDVIGITRDAIEVVGSSVEEVTLALLEYMQAQSCDTLTLLAGEDFSDDEFRALRELIEATYEDLEIDAHRGDQPLYPVILAVE